ncbi:MAG TPA: type II toxin-antitoxin system prevent-host-death family antitoxin [Actinomycetota bacterium]|nr:type II toxin-antitoxin system prevent-host-death family antitoxin [Actinomycetota bacterium]
MDVGVRELRSNLRKWLDAVEAGDEVTITERGRPIARIVGVDRPTAYERLIAEGVITPAREPKQPSRTYGKVKARGTVSDLVAEQRR